MPKRGPMNTYAGWYKVRRPKKYIGQKPPYYRSSWEARFMNFLEENKMVKRWGSENLKVPYKLPDASTHNYIIDFYVEIYDTAGKLQKYAVEIKPNSQTGNKAQPRKPKNNSKKAWDNYNAKMKKIHVNQFKWEAATRFCKSRGFKFIVLTEDVCL